MSRKTAPWFDMPEEPASTVPILECSKAMARGIGYAGEGNLLTASLQVALKCAFGATSFVEMFCPDWGGQLDLPVADLLGPGPRWPP